jgi:hypothetical protein
MPLTLLATRQVETLPRSPKGEFQPILRSSLRTTRAARFARSGVALASMLLSSVALLSAQQPASSPPDAPSATRKVPKGMVETVSQKSLFFPNIATSENRLSTGDKFKLFAANSASLGSLLGAAASAGIEQALTSPHGYREGAEGYGKRFGASMARNASSEFFGTFILASMLHEDPRFFPQADPTLGGSIKYAVTRVFVTRNDDGKDVANVSGLLGPAMAEGLANAYWPEGERTAGNTLERYGVDIAARAGYNLFRNYWPVFFKKLRGSPRH